jgi:hypothetical protein
LSRTRERGDRHPPISLVPIGETAEELTRRPMVDSLLPIIPAMQFRSAPCGNDDD